MKKFLVCILLIIITILLIIKVYDSKAISALNIQINKLNEENSKISLELNSLKLDNKKYINDISDMEEIIKSLNETIDEISKLKNRKPIQDTYPIDIRLSKCIQYSKSNSQDYNCQYMATKNWEKEMNKSLFSLKKKMKAEDYKILLDNQKKWETSTNNSIELMDKYISKQGGMIQQVIVESETSNIYKTRALILNNLDFFINDYYYAEKFKE